MSHNAPFTPSVTHPNFTLQSIKKDKCLASQGFGVSLQKLFHISLRTKPPCGRCVSLALMPVHSAALHQPRRGSSITDQWYFQLLLLSNEMLQSQRDNVLICSPRSENVGCEWYWVHKLILFVSLQKLQSPSTTRIFSQSSFPLFVCLLYTSERRL